MALKIQKNIVPGTWNTNRIELQNALRQIPNLPNRYIWILQLKDPPSWAYQYGNNYGISLYTNEIKELNELWKTRKK